MSYTQKNFQYTLKDICEYVDDINKLKKKLYDGSCSKASAEKILKEMRITHGCAILSYKIRQRELMNKKDNNMVIKDSDLISISADSSFLHIIHSCIRNSEKYLMEKGIISKNPHSSIQNIQNPRIEVNIRSIPNGNDIISIHNLTTPEMTYKDDFNDSDTQGFFNRIQDKRKEDMNYHNNSLSPQYNNSNVDSLNKGFRNWSEHITENFSDLMKNLSTDQLNDLFSDYKSGVRAAGINTGVISGGADLPSPPNPDSIDKINKSNDRFNNDNLLDDDLTDTIVNNKHKLPILIYFGALGCPYCIKMKPEWDKFVASKPQWLHVKEYTFGKSIRGYDEDNPDNDPIIQEIKKGLQINSYPTIVLISMKDNKIDIVSASGARPNEEIKKFVNNNL